MRGIIIAAGRGIRMAPLTRERPKCLLPIGERTLLDFTVERLRANGCEEIVIITGHCADAIQRDDLVRVENTNFKDNNILHSLMYAKPYIEGDVIITYSDIWVEPDIYETLCAASGDIVIAVDKDWEPYYQGRTEHPLSEAESVVVGPDGGIVRIGKHLTADDASDMLFGEFLGLWRMTPDGARQFVDMFEQIEARLTLTEPFQNAKEWQKAYITDILQEIIDNGGAVSSALIERGWAELDTVQDYERLPGITVRQRMFELTKYLGSHDV
ncbi:phosphocholine cytidylyltransferase family protein [Thalassospiraceae bacterium LMO-JJ14]|nr:phosphocholine cytidylyltransferase family protein [Thalassospiraceae bacterium LMO-JJ14]